MPFRITGRLALIAHEAATTFTPSEALVRYAASVASHVNLARITRTKATITPQDALAVLAVADRVVEASIQLGYRWTENSWFEVNARRVCRRDLALAAMERGESLVGPLQERLEYHSGFGTDNVWRLVTDPARVPDDAVVRVRMICPTRPMLTAHTGDPAAAVDLAVA